MFGRVERAMHRNVVVGLAVVAALLLLTGLVVCLASPAAHSRPGTAQRGSTRPEPARIAPAAP